jgi:hypothetical protein
MIENIANILGFRKIYKPILTIDDALGNATNPTNELTFLENYYKALIAEDEKTSDALKKELQSDQAIILRHFIDLFYKAMSHQNYVIVNTRHAIPKVYRDIDSLARYWKTKKYQLGDDEAYLRTTIENNIDYYQIVELS